MIENNLQKLNAFIQKQGLRSSSAREAIAREFFKIKTHVTIDELLARAKKTHPKIGIATVYRTLHLLQEFGLAVRRDFSGVVSFEPLEDLHHDHLICTSCGKIVEFFFEEIEKAQSKVAKKYDFVLKDHKMELYGICKKCRSSAPSKKS